MRLSREPMVEDRGQKGPSLSCLLPEHSISFLPESLALNFLQPCVFCSGVPCCSWDTPHFLRSSGWESLSLPHCDSCPALTSQGVAMVPELRLLHSLTLTSQPSMLTVPFLWPLLELSFDWQEKNGADHGPPGLCSALRSPSPSLTPER